MKELISRGIKVDRKLGLVFSLVLSLFSVLSAVGITFSGNNLAKLVFFFSGSNDNRNNVAGEGQRG